MLDVKVAVGRTLEQAVRMAVDRTVGQAVRIAKQKGGDRLTVKQAEL